MNLNRPKKTDTFHGVIQILVVTRPYCINKLELSHILSLSQSPTLRADRWYTVTQSIRIETSGEEHKKHLITGQ